MNSTVIGKRGISNKIKLQVNDAVIIPYMEWSVWHYKINT